MIGFRYFLAFSAYYTTTKVLAWIICVVFPLLSQMQACIDSHTRRKPSYLGRSMTLDPATTSDSAEHHQADTPTKATPPPPAPPTSETGLVSGKFRRRSTKTKLLPLSSASLALMDRVSRNDGSGLWFDK